MDQNAVKFLQLVNHLFSDNITWRIIKNLSRSDGLTLRELARRCEVAPKTLYKYLNALQKKGIVEVYRPGPRVMVVKLSDQYNWIRQLLNHN